MLLRVGAAKRRKLRQRVEIAAAFTLATGIIASVICLLGYTPYSVDGFLAAFGLEPSGGAMLMIAQAWSDWTAAAARALALLILLLAMHRTRRAVWATAALLFVCGAVCMATKRNAIGILMGVELVLNGASVNFVAFARYNRTFEIEGQIFALFVIVLAAAEAAIALAIVLNFYNNHMTVDVDTAEELKG